MTTMIHMIFGLLFVALFFLAAIMQIALIRDAYFQEGHTSESSRWLMVAGFATLAVRFAYMLHEQGRVTLPWYSVISLSLITLGSILIALEKLAIAAKSQTPGGRRKYDPTNRKGWWPR
jgi:hypothetical protein